MILRRYLQQAPLFEPANYVLFLAALEHKGVRTGAVPPSYTVRTKCEDCDEWCYRIKLTDGTAVLVVINGDRYVLHQCPVAEAQLTNNQWQDDDSEPL